jgi:hypothetical protein
LRPEKGALQQQLLWNVLLLGTFSQSFDFFEIL